MNNQSLREHLAVKVMGWENTAGDIYWSGGVAKSYISSWRPDKDIEQAFMLLDKFEQWGISCNLIDNGYFVSIIEWPKEGRDQEWEAEDKSLPMAISLAVAKATGRDDGSD